MTGLKEITTTRGISPDSRSADQGVFAAPESIGLQFQVEDHIVFLGKCEDFFEGWYALSNKLAGKPPPITYPAAYVVNGQLAHTYTATGPFAIIATATLSDGSTPTTGGIAGGPDPTFKGDGVVQIDGSSGWGDAVAVGPDDELAVALPGQLMLYASDGTEEAAVNTGLGGYWGSQQVAFEPDGKILVGGETEMQFGEGRGQVGEVFAVERYSFANNTLTLDTSFGAGGVATASFFGPGEQVNVSTVLVQPNGMIVLAGWAWDAGNDADAGYNIAVAQLRARRKQPRSQLRPQRRRHRDRPGRQWLLGGAEPDGDIVVGGQSTSEGVGMLVRFDSSGNLENRRVGYRVRRRRHRHHRLRRRRRQHDNRRGDRAERRYRGRRLRRLLRLLCRALLLL